LKNCQQSIQMNYTFYIFFGVLYYDAHTHLNDEKLYPDWKAHLHTFFDQGGKWLVNVWVDHERNKRAIDIAIQAKSLFTQWRVKATIGYHPSEVCFGKIQNKKDIQHALQLLRDLYTDNKEHILAIGEWWIDTHYDGDSHIDLQQELFAQQCNLAQEFDLPIVIHSREDFASTWDVVKNYKNQKIYFHCRWYGPEELQKLQDYFPNFRVWFCGNSTYPKAQNLRDSLAIVRKDSVVLETDAPYLTPQKMRGKTNTPSYIQYIYEYITTISPTITAKQIEQNIHTLYTIV